MGRLPLPYLLFLLLVAAQRLVELLHSKRNVARLRQAHGDAPPKQAEGVYGFGLMVGVHVLSILLPMLEVAINGLRSAPWLQVLGVCVFGAAQGLRYWTIRTLGSSWNVRAEVSPATRIVNTGPYRYLRHPNYLAVCLEFLAIPAIGGAWYALVLLQLLHTPIVWRRICAEERLLYALPGYRASMAGRGCLLPRWPRHDSSQVGSS